MVLAVCGILYSIGYITLPNVEIFRKSESGKMWGCGSAPKIKAARVTYGLAIY